MKKTTLRVYCSNPDPDRISRHCSWPDPSSPEPAWRREEAAGEGTVAGGRGGGGDGRSWGDASELLRRLGAATPTTRWRRTGTAVADGWAATAAGAAAAAEAVAGPRREAARGGRLAGSRGLAWAGRAGGGGRWRPPRVDARVAGGGGRTLYGPVRTRPAAAADGSRV